MIDATRGRRSALVRGAAFGMALLLSCAVRLPSLASAEDTVVLGVRGGPGRQVLTGEIVEYNGRELVLRRVGGREDRIAADRVREVHTEWVSAQKTAEQRMREARFEDAIVLLRQAASAEPRNWVRRRILSELIECHTQLEQYDVAGDLFAALMQSDPETPHFHVMPLSWGHVAPPAGLETKAAQWLAQDVPAMRLLGASWLLSGARRGEAASTLRRLVGDRDSRVAFLATAQLWRVDGVAATDDQLLQWRQTIERMPEALRAGPYFVLANALARHGDHDRAALAYLRVPIEYSARRRLAAEALWSAASVLEKQQRLDEAVTLWREIATIYPEAASAPSARAKLQQMERKPANTAPAGGS